MPNTPFVIPENAQQIQMKTGVYRRTMAMTDEMMVCEFFLERGALIDTHSHFNDQVGYVVYGLIEMTIDDLTRTCKPGDSYAIPGGIAHHVRVIIDSLIIDVFSPPRDDYRTEHPNVLK